MTPIALPIIPIIKNMISVIVPDFFGKNIIDNIKNNTQIKFINSIVVKCIWSILLVFSMINLIISIVSYIKNIKNAYFINSNKSF